MAMTSSRPYIIRALYEWIIENECTPYILVNAFEGGVEVPQEHVKDGQIILNVSPSAVKSLSIHNHAVDFEGRFAGIPKQVFVPINAILGIYAKENGQGMIFDADNDGSEPPEPEGSGASGGSAASDNQGIGVKKPSLRIVK
ncbi:ClpXP protease specificity-enhancing factor [Gammaproteobacteria bacterium]|jgi:stringent starvation protein B|nr:ClpXP protease specificity-enhancing factor [Gammaproteobacteria bacterium]MAX07842.1 ClpXP protease specificity-enhancing factor [Gammaproteobacteria bacterium]MDC0221987.1 ClpXP protease specificity-enhancing factor [Gammaproteobacteria bacterium]|tara:strand:+ start:364 stop:789 length:426 start_codon:yes stop_codon:yes gene_type:complete